MQMNQSEKKHTDRQAEEEKNGNNCDEDDGRIDLFKAVNTVRLIMMMNLSDSERGSGDKAEPVAERRRRYRRRRVTAERNPVNGGVELEYGTPLAIETARLDHLSLSWRVNV